MIPIIKRGSRTPAKAHQIILLSIDAQDDAREDGQILKARKITQLTGQKFVVFHQDTGLKAYVFMPRGEDSNDRLEEARLLGHGMLKPLKDHGVSKVHIFSGLEDSSIPLAFAEGMVLGSYRNVKYKTQEDQDKSTLEEIVVQARGVAEDAIGRLNTLMEATHWARDLVNEPLNKLNAKGLADAISDRLKPLGVRVETFNKKRIESLRMGGLLAVNRGSLDPPTFSILEWKPEQAINDRPYILVGKGVVFDTGGISLKPAAHMDEMKSDMAGAAAAAAVVYALASMQWPIYLIALIPATDNRPDGNAYVPGDVITMFDGTTVEVINTDAEGRLILADALSYAKKFDPLLLINLATLTGSASRATGKLAAVAMQSQAKDAFSLLLQAGERTRERLVELPMWKEYEELIRSEIADIKNAGGAEAGAITAGVFLKLFTSYPFIHLDIAGTAYLSKRHNYRGQGATGATVRLLVHFFQEISRLDRN